MTETEEKLCVGCGQAVPIDSITCPYCQYSVFETQKRVSERDQLKFEDCAKLLSKITSPPPRQRRRFWERKKIITPMSRSFNRGRRKVHSLHIIDHGKPFTVREYFTSLPPTTRMADARPVIVLKHKVRNWIDYFEVYFEYSSWPHVSTEWHFCIDHSKLRRRDRAFGFSFNPHNVEHLVWLCLVYKSKRVSVVNGPKENLLVGIDYDFGTGGGLQLLGKLDEMAHKTASQIA